MSSAFGLDISGKVLGAGKSTVLIATAVGAPMYTKGVGVGMGIIGYSLNAPGHLFV